MSFVKPSCTLDFRLILDFRESIHEHLARGADVSLSNINPAEIEAAVAGFGARPLCIWPAHSKAYPREKENPSADRGARSLGLSPPPPATPLSSPHRRLRGARIEARRTPGRTPKPAPSLDE